jgi:hypothetical protein
MPSQTRTAKAQKNADVPSRPFERGTEFIIPIRELPINANDAVSAQTIVESSFVNFKTY